MFVSFRLLVVESIHNGINRLLSYIRWPVEPANSPTSSPSFTRRWLKTNPATISDATIQMDHNAVVLFTIDRLACSTAGRTRAARWHRKGPRPVVYKINLRFRRFGCGTGQITGLNAYYIACPRPKDAWRWSRVSPQSRDLT